MAEKKPPLNQDTHRALMGDLQSIRTLLESDGDDEHEHNTTDEDEQNIPVLEDVVLIEGSSVPSTTAVPEDGWKTASDAFVAQAKAAIQTKGLGDHLSKAQSALIDILVDTLKAAVDAEIDHIRSELYARLDHIKSEIFKDGD